MTERRPSKTEEEEEEEWERGEREGEREEDGCAATAACKAYVSVFTIGNTYFTFLKTHFT